MDPDNPIEESTITLPLSVLASLIFGEYADKHLPKIPKPLSLAPGDLARPIITHYNIGQLIASIDSREIYFHVALFPNSHAEVWYAPEWLQSNARRERIKKHAAIERIARDEEKELITLLTDELTALGPSIPDAFCRLVAYQIAINYKTSDLSAVIKLWKLDEAMAGYLDRKKMEAETTKETNIMQ